MVWLVLVGHHPRRDQLSKSDGLEGASEGLFSFRGLGLGLGVALGIHEHVSRHGRSCRWQTPPGMRALPSPPYMHPHTGTRFVKLSSTCVGTCARNSVPWGPPTKLEGPGPHRALLEVLGGSGQVSSSLDPKHLTMLLPAQLSPG